MNDDRVDFRNVKMNRKENDLNISKAREDFKITLRKEKLDNYLQEKRFKTYSENSFSELEVNVKDLNISPEIIETMSSLNREDKLEYIYDLLKSNYLDHIKFSLFTYRNQLISEQAIFNPKIFQLICYIVLNEKKFDCISINECLWCLINITYNENESHVFEILISDEMLLFYSNNIKRNEFKENILYLVSNLIGGDSNSRRKILTSKIYEEILMIIKEENLYNIYLICLETFVNIYRKNNQEEISQYLLSNERINETSKIMNLLIIHLSDKILLLKILECLVELTQKLPQDNRVFINKEFIERLFYLNNIIKRSYCFKILGNLVSYGNLAIYELLQFNLIENLKELLDDEHFSYKREAIWIISNLACSSKYCNLQLVKSDILRSLKNCFNEGDKFIKKEVLNNFYNMSYYSNLDIANYLEHIGVFEILLFFIELNQEANCIEMSLIGLFNLLSLDDGSFFIEKLKSHGGYDKLEKIYNHKNENIKRAASTILSHFFVNINEEYS